MASGWHLEVRGPIPAAVVGEIHRRYGPVAIAARGPRTLLAGTAADQAELRGLLTLLWDVNNDVLRLEVIDGD